MDEQEYLIGVSEAAARAGVHKNTIRKWVNDEILPAYWTPGGHRRIKPSDLESIAFSRIKKGR